MTLLTTQLKIVGRALGLNDEQAMNAISNNCAMVMKHSIARKCRYLPVEVISKSDFESRYPEINLNDSQSSVRNIDTTNSDSDEEDDDVVKNAMIAPPISSAIPSLVRNEEGLIDHAEVTPISIISNLLNSSISVLKCDINISEMDYDAAIIVQEGILESSAVDNNSFALGDSFISFSSGTASSPEFKKRIISDLDIPTSNKKMTIMDRDITTTHIKIDSSQIIKKVMNTPKSLKSKGKFSSRRKG